MAVKYLEKFVWGDAAGTTYTFPVKGMEWSEDAALRTPDAAAIGADGSHDYLGSGVAPRDPVGVTVRFLDVQATAAALEADIDDVRARLHLGALGKLWTLDSAAVRRWSQARVVAMPEHPRQPGQFLHMPVILKFRREPYWYDEALTTVNQTLSAYQTNFTITNPGNAYVRRNLVFTITANAPGGWSNLSILNVNTGERVATTRDAGFLNEVWRVAPGEAAVQFARPGLVFGKSGAFIGNATVGGQHFAGDYDLAAIGSLQSGLLSLKPGANSIQVTCDGAPSATFSATFYGAWS